MDKLPQIQEKIVESEDLSSEAAIEGANEEPLPPVLEDVIKEKQKISQEEIFAPSARNKNLEVQKIKKPKREISDAQKERLRLGREKGLASRRAKAEAKKKLKEIIPQQLKEEFKKTAVKEKSEEISQAPPPQEISRVNPVPSVSKDDIIDITAKASAKALEDYELVRKKRKQIKKQQKEEENHREKVRQTIRTAVKGPEAPDPFGFCFQ
tara:strand:- start:208 stop:837 length:630 start_codon:yes stop_codon:yes gene_type:complete